jgi:hypothetical protein
MRPLQFGQFTKQAIVDGVRDFGFGLDVIEIVVAPDLVPQGSESSLDICGRHAIDEVRRSRSEDTARNQLLS